MQSWVAELTVGTAKYLDDPDYRSALLEEYKFGLRKTYVDLQVALGLPPTQIDDLLGLLAERQLQEATDLPTSVTLDQQQLADYHARQQRETERALQELLGAEVMDRWHEYLASLPTREELTRLRTELDAAGLPLSREQVETVIKALQAAQAPPAGLVEQLPAPTSNEQTRRQVYLPAGEEEALAQRQRAAVQPYLLPKQFALFEQLKQQQQHLRRAYLQELQ
jgi:hypothetical protein